MFDFLAFGVQNRDLAGRSACARHQSAPRARVDDECNDYDHDDYDRNDNSDADEGDYYDEYADTCAMRRMIPAGVPQASLYIWIIYGQLERRKTCLEVCGAEIFHPGSARTSCRGAKAPAG